MLENIAELMSVKDVEKAIMRAPQTIYNWRSMSVAMPEEVRVGGDHRGKILYRKCDIIQWIETGLIVTHAAEMADVIKQVTPCNKAIGFNKATPCAYTTATIV